MIGVVASPVRAEAQDRTHGDQDGDHVERNAHQPVTVYPTGTSAHTPRSARAPRSRASASIRAGRTTPATVGSASMIEGRRPRPRPDSRAVAGQPRSRPTALWARWSAWDASADLLSRVGCSNVEQYTQNGRPKATMRFRSGVPPSSYRLGPGFSGPRLLTRRIETAAPTDAAPARRRRPPVPRHRRGRRPRRCRRAVWRRRPARRT